ncbi:MAG: hypothetical protein QHH06_11565 [Clostridiales bacterium]|nr:hypothetical protein [Eubacteriales bacterium]MDH7567100.1 hypothetical protein [Clostridiales bacterium]
MAKVEVNPGICGFHTTIRVTAQGKQNVKIDFATTCPSMKPLEEELKEANGIKECFAKVGESNIYQICRKYCKHAACPVPSAIIKGIEVACGLALPKNVEMKISKEE